MLPRVEPERLLKAMGKAGLIVDESQVLSIELFAPVRARCCLWQIVAMHCIIALEVKMVLYF